MPAVATQLLADETDLANLGPPLAALSALSSTIKRAHLRAASGTVLAAYRKRYALPLAQWGDFTKKIVIAFAVFSLLGTARGFSAETADGKMIVAARDDAQRILDEIIDITNKNAREDPDVIDATPEYDEMSALSASEGGCADEADNFARRRVPGLTGICSPGNGIAGGGCL